MKLRVLVATFLLLGGFCGLVLISGAPLRVHAYRGLIVLPTILAASLMYWIRSLTLIQKATYLSLIAGLGALLATYLSTFVFLKVEFGSTSYFANLLIFYLGPVILVFSTNHLVRIFSRKKGQQ